MAEATPSDPGSVHLVVFKVVLADMTIELFDQASFKANLAAKLLVAPSDVAIDAVAAGSVHADVKVTVLDAAAANMVASKVEAFKHDLVDSATFGACKVSGVAVTVVSMKAAPALIRQVSCSFRRFCSALEYARVESRPHIAPNLNQI